MAAYYLSTCKKCSRHESGLVGIFDEGYEFDPDPDLSRSGKVMIIGEAPGTRDFTVSELFQGRLDKTLLQKLKRAGISYPHLSYAVRCYHEDKPKKAHRVNCSSYTHKEIKLHDPAFILCLGSVATASVLGEEYKFKDLRGKPIIRDGRVIFPTHHVTAALDQRKSTQLEADINFFCELATGARVMINHNPPYKTYSTDPDSGLPSIMDSIPIIDELGKVLSLDIETTGLSPWRDNSYINQIQLGTDKGILVLQFPIPPTQKFLEFLKSVLLTKRLVAHNAVFDFLFLNTLWGLELEPFFDTMIADYVLDENRNHGLKEIATREFGAPNYDADLSTKTSLIAPKKLAKYGALDVYYTHLAYMRFHDQLNQDPPLRKFFDEVMMPGVIAFLAIEERGVYVDKVQLEKSYNQVYAAQTKFFETLQEYGDINWGSTQQVAKVFFEQLDLPVIDHTPTGKPQLNESTLKRMRSSHEAPQLLLDYREQSKFLSTYLLPWQEWLATSTSPKRLRPRFRLTGTVTGRLSCADPNLQQVPRNPLIRSIISAPPKLHFVEADFSQVELRIAAMSSDDPVMKRVFNEGMDIHTYTAEIVSGQKAKDISPDELKEWRKKAKPINFGFLYGMGARKFGEYARDKYEVIFTPEECEDFRDRFFSAYPGLMLWHERMIEIAREQGYVTNPLGRRRRLPNILHSDNGLRRDAERQAINSPVQSLASDLTLCAVIVIQEQLSHHVKVVGTVHDSILMEVSSKNRPLLETIKDIKSIMEDNPLTKALGFKPTVPIIADVAVGPWGKGIPYTELMS